MHGYSKEFLANTYQTDQPFRKALIEEVAEIRNCLRALAAECHVLTIVAKGLYTATVSQGVPGAPDVSGDELRRWHSGWASQLDALQLPTRVANPLLHTLRVSTTRWDDVLKEHLPSAPYVDGSAFGLSDYITDHRLLPDPVAWTRATALLPSVSHSQHCFRNLGPKGWRTLIAACRDWTAANPV